MKNCKKLVVVLLWFLFLLSFSFAGNVSQKNRETAEIIMTALEKNLNKETVIGQISKYEKLINAFWMVKFRDNNQREMITYLVECLKKKVNNLKSQVETQDQVISNVDWDRVQREWLSWHNEERSEKWLSPYTYSDALNYTSLARAQQIANEKRKTWSTHARKSSDWYRNTDSIRERFSNLWVNVVYFSESNAYGYYNCKKSDCTQEMIDVLKKCFDRTFLDWPKGSHYLAVVSSTFDQIWMWVATNWTYVWLTTHYWKNVK